jgi:hypothetical protein
MDVPNFFQLFSCVYHVMKKKQDQEALWKGARERRVENDIDRVGQASHSSAALP